jgi:hypothetical protein
MLCPLCLSPSISSWAERESFRLSFRFADDSEVMARSPGPQCPRSPGSQFGSAFEESSGLPLSGLTTAEAIPDT